MPVELLTWLADDCRAEGLVVVEESGWETRSQNDWGRGYDSIGLLNHHTAPPVPYPVQWLYQKCNLNVKPDGTVHVIAAGYQWDSGQGAPEVLDAVRNDRPLPPLAGLTSTISGNPWFIDIEVDHWGGGQKIPAVQLDALIGCNVAICRHQQWDPRFRLIGHKEWAPDRKIDPRWDDGQPGDEMTWIRAETFRRLAMGWPPNTRHDFEDPIGRLPIPDWADGLPEHGQTRGLTSMPQLAGRPAHRYDLYHYDRAVVEPLEQRIARLEAGEIVGPDISVLQKQVDDLEDALTFLKQQLVEAGS